MVVLKAAEILINIEVSYMSSYVGIYKHVQMPPSSALNKQTNNINKSQSKYESTCNVRSQFVVLSLILNFCT